MSQRPKREVKAPEKFQIWTNGDRHEPFSIRNHKKKEKEDKVMSQMYQCLYREVKKPDNDKEKEDGIIRVNKKMKKREVKGLEKSNKENNTNADKNVKLAEQQETYKTYQQMYREKAKEKKEEEKEKKKKYQESYRKMKKMKKCKSKN